MITSDQPVRYGYTMRDLDRIAKQAAYNALTGARSNADADELYAVAWGAVAEALCGADSKPTGSGLRGVALDAVDALRREMSRDRGYSASPRYSGSHVAPRFLQYWIRPQHHDPVADLVVERVAVAQVLAGLSPSHRRALLLLGTYENDLRAAAEASGHRSINDVALRARKNALKLWHDGETPPRIGVGGTGRRRVSYPCGTKQAYVRHGKHRERPCDECRAAWSVHMAAYNAKKRAGAA